MVEPPILGLQEDTVKSFFLYKHKPVIIVKNVPPNSLAPYVPKIIAQKEIFQLDDA